MQEPELDPTNPNLPPILEIKPISTNTTSIIERQSDLGEIAPPAQEASIPPKVEQTIYGPEQATPLEPQIQTTNNPETVIAPEPAAEESVAETDESKEKKVEKEQTPISPETQKNIENALKEVDFLAENVRRLRITDQTLTDEAAYHAEKIRRVLTNADPREAGYREIQEQIQNLARRLNQTIERFSNDSMILTSRTEAGADEIKRQLKNLESTSDSQVRQRILDKSIQIYYELTTNFFSKRVGNGSMEEARRNLLSQAKQDTETATSMRNRFTSLYSNTNPESLILQYQRTVSGFAEAFHERNRQLSAQELQFHSENKTHFHNFEGLITSIKKSPDLAPETPEQEAPKPPEATTTQTPEAATEQQPPNGINAVQKEVIDRAFADPQTKARLETVINTFGTDDVKAYFNSKLVS